MLPGVSQVHKLSALAALLHVLHQLDPHSGPLLHLRASIRVLAWLVVLLPLLLQRLWLLLLLLGPCRRVGRLPARLTASAECWHCSLLGLMLRRQAGLPMLQRRQLPTGWPADAADAAAATLPCRTCSRASVKGGARGSTGSGSSCCRSRRA